MINVDQGLYHDPYIIMSMIIICAKPLAWNMSNSIIFNFILAEVFQLKLLPYFIVLTFPKLEGCYLSD